VNDDNRQAKASVKMFLTQAEKQALRDLGYSDEAISHMKPEVGAGIIARRDVAPEADGAQGQPGPPPGLPTHNMTLAETFLDALDPDAERFTFLLVNETGWPYRNPIVRHCTLAKIWPEVVRWNQPQDRYAVYVTVNETDGSGKRETKNIVRVRGLFVDADTPESVEKLRGVVAETKLTPSICVYSKLDRAHAYWLTEDTPLEQFAWWQNALIQLFGSDGKIHDLPRVMRLPGTLHLKGEPLLVRALVSEPRLIYPTQTLVDGFKLVSPAHRGAHRGAHSQSKPSGEPPSINDALSAGLDRGWFDELSDDDKDEALRQMFAACPDIARGGRGPWLKCLMAAHSSGAPHAEDIAREWSMLSKDKYSDAEFDKAWASLDDQPDGVSMGTLIMLARERAFDAYAWIAYVNETRQEAQQAAQQEAQQAAHPSTSSGAASPEPPKNSPPLTPPVGGQTLESTLPQQTIYDTPGRKAEVMDALDRRVAADPYTFQSGDRLISLRISPGAALLFHRIVDRDASAPGGVALGVTDECDMPVMLETGDADIAFLADLDIWMGSSQGRVAEGGQPKLKRVHAPTETCKSYLKLSRPKMGFRQLNGLARVPIIDDAGNLDFGVGYHQATGVFRDRTPALDVPDRPTREDCKAALDTLMAPFAEYQFPEMKLGQALVLTLILTALERPFIRTAPMFGINGVAGVGKGKLIRVVTQLAFHTAPRFMTYGFNADEFDKRVGSMFRIPAPCLVIDNANGKRISNDALESIITEGGGHVRTLGKSELVHVVNRSLLVVTGRGLEFSGDMTRREFTLNLLASDASPETRLFKLDPPVYVAEHRDELLARAFTLMRAFRQAGAPELAKTAVGSFPEWEWRVRDLVMWVTGIDVTDQFARNREIASDKQADAALLHALYGVFADKPFRASDAQRVYDDLALQKRLGGFGSISVVRSPDQEAEEAKRKTKIALFEALEKFGDAPVNSRRIGKWAGNVENAHIAALRLTRTSDGEGHTDIFISRTSGSPSPE
jgi:hypothetical protein